MYVYVKKSRPRARAQLALIVVSCRNGGGRVGVDGRPAGPHIGVAGRLRARGARRALNGRRALRPACACAAR
jgi:hypothetical protein